ncbi:uncharacterized protein M6B38_306410 [Iris pallida]|uniref:Uncharacterized protein n=1 Tax=Iris pallida TaxID=29817 RepID=A0AAX6HMC8_IRIPA|nr:uncharacterized protein M6B38_306410 [Iris pallida]
MELGRRYSPWEPIGRGRRGGVDDRGAGLEMRRMAATGHDAEGDEEVSVLTPGRCSLVHRRVRRTSEGGRNVVLA